MSCPIRMCYTTLHCALLPSVHVMRLYPLRIALRGGATSLRGLPGGPLRLLPKWCVLAGGWQRRGSKTNLGSTEFKSWAPPRRTVGDSSPGRLRSTGGKLRAQPQLPVGRRTLGTYSFYSIYSIQYSIYNIYNNYVTYKIYSIQ